MPGLLRKLKFLIKGRALRPLPRVFTAVFYAQAFLPVLTGAAVAGENGPSVLGIDPIWLFLGFGVTLFVIGSSIAFALVFRRKITAEPMALLKDGADFRELAEFAADWVWEMDADLRFSYLSPRFFEIFEIPQEMILGKTRAEYTEHNDTNISSEDWKKHLKILDDRLPFRDLRYSIKDNHGRTRFLRVSGQPVFGEDGEFTGYQGVGTDLTPEYDATAQAAQAEATLMDAIESISTGFSLWDSDDRMVLCNSKWREAHPEMDRLAEPGIPFEEYFTGVAKVAVYDPEMGDLETQVRERMEYHNNTPSHHEQHFADGRWINIHEYDTHDGGTVILWTDISDRKKAEQALEESEARYRSLIESTSVIAWEVNLASWRFTYVSPHAVDLLGYKVDEWYAKGFWPDHIHPDDREQSVSFCRTATERGENHDFEYRMIAKDGHSVWLRDIVTVVTEEGRPVSLRGFMIDISDRKKAEKALEESERRFRNLIEGSVQGVLIHDRHKPLFVNQAYAEIFGYDDPDDLFAHGDALGHVALHERDRMKDYSKSRVRGEETPETYEFEGVRKDGSSIWVENRARVVIWEDRKAIQRTIVDITERKRTEESLRQSEENYRNLVEGSVQGIFIHRDFKPLFVNEVLVEMFGYDSPEEVMALPSVDLLYAPEERARLRDMYDARLRGRPVPGYYEFKGLKKDGTIIWLQRTTRTVTWEGEFAVQGAIMDITDIKNAEENLRRAKEIAETANRAKSEFLANMSHELRTPLNSVIGFSEVIKDQHIGPPGGKQYLEYANYIYSSGQHLLGLISDILDVSKIEVGEMDVSEDNIDAGTVVETCAKMIKERADRAKVRLTVENAQGCPGLVGDERRLKQILLNLLSNAVKFTPPQGKVNVGARPLEGGVQFWVADTGIGISEEDIPLVLKPFAQVASSQTRGHEGTGLGLSLAQSLSELQGAQLEIKSKTGEGTTVTVNFPSDRALGSLDREAGKA